MGSVAPPDVGTTGQLDKFQNTYIHHQFVAIHQGTRLLPLNSMSTSQFSSLAIFPGLLEERQ
jgi:hypothetical protein